MQKIVFTLALLFAGLSRPVRGQTTAPTAPAAELRVGGAVSTPLTLTAADLKSMPRKSLAVVNPHSQKRKRMKACHSKRFCARPAFPTASIFVVPQWPLTSWRKPRTAIASYSLWQNSTPEFSIAASSSQIHWTAPRSPKKKARSRLSLRVKSAPRDGFACSNPSPWFAHNSLQSSFPCGADSYSA